MHRNNILSMYINFDLELAPTPYNIIQTRKQDWALVTVQQAPSDHTHGGSWKQLWNTVRMYSDSAYT